MKYTNKVTGRQGDTEKGGCTLIPTFTHSEAPARGGGVRSQGAQGDGKSPASGGGQSHRPRTERSEFTFKQNRSERAIQAELLIPALAAKDIRRKLLAVIQPLEGFPIDVNESDAASVMHFIWVLRDTFFVEREKAAKNKQWTALRERWQTMLGLQEWASEPGWWRHPDGSYNNDADYVVHPCNRDIGWTEHSITKRIQEFGLDAGEDRIARLVESRKIMNTECDCLIQTPNRIIVVECKDKTDFILEQENRQQKLFECLKRLLVRPQELLYVEISSQPPKSRPNQFWSWDMLRHLVFGGKE